MSRLLARLALLALLVAPALRAAPPPELPVATFFKKANIAQLAFSPDGKRIACLVPFERRMNLAVIDLEKKTKNLLTNFKDNDVGSLLWASNDRIIFTRDADGQEWASVYAINRDGSNGVLLAGGAGVETALVAAAEAGDGWAFERLRESVVRARSARRSIWDELARFGARVGIPQIEEVAGSVRLAGEHGARVRLSLAARADSLRQRQMGELEAAAQSATERMGVPMVGLFLAFIVLVGYPAVALVLDGL